MKKIFFMVLFIFLMFVGLTSYTFAATVTFDANGGSGTMPTQSFSVGEVKNLTINSYTKKNYAFTCWNTKANGTGESYADGALYNTTSDETLYAKWELCIHGWTHEVWYAVDSTQHQRTCSVCGIVQSREHSFFDVEPKDVKDIEKHYSLCTLCVDEDNNQYKLEGYHVDRNGIGNHGNGICDLCGAELWNITLDEEDWTNQDVTLSAEIFSDYSDQKIYPDSVKDSFGNEILGANGEYKITENGIYQVTFINPNIVIPVTISNIDKEILGRVYRMLDNDGNISLILKTSNVKTGKTIKAKGTNEINTVTWNNATEEDGWTIGTAKIENVVNGNTYYFTAIDSLGNKKLFTVSANGVISGIGSITTTFDTFVGGYIFTDILVNVNKSWEQYPIDFTATIKKTDDANSETEFNNGISVVQIKNWAGIRVTDNPISAGIYYINVAIGGPYVFSSVGTYLINVEGIKLKDSDGNDIDLTGKNRIEVVVQELKDLT